MRTPSIATLRAGLNLTAAQAKQVKAILTAGRFDRFDIAEAWYLALSHCHSGQGSNEYRRLCRLSRYFRPRPSLSAQTLTENGLEIYTAACARLLAAV